jgi:hypothetical protein
MAYSDIDRPASDAHGNERGAFRHSGHFVSEVIQMSTHLLPAGNEDGGLISRLGRLRLWRDLRSGQAGWLVRLGLSLASATGLVALALLCTGVVELLHAGRMDDTIGAMFLGAGAAVWCGVLILLWWHYSRLQVVLRTFFAVVAVWAIVMPLGIAIEQHVRRSDFLLAAVIFFGISISLLLLIMIPYHFRRVARQDVLSIDIVCPACGYDMRGLSETRCPECGECPPLETFLQRQIRVTRIPLEPSAMPTDDGSPRPPELEDGGARRRLPA